MPHCLRWRRFTLASERGESVNDYGCGFAPSLVQTNLCALQMPAYLPDSPLSLSGKGTHEGEKGAGGESQKHWESEGLKKAN
jgi:hypothetical protein